MEVRTTFNRLRRVLVGWRRTQAEQQPGSLQRQVRYQDDVRVALAALLTEAIVRSATSCNDAEFRSFSQFGEDGIIEHLIRNCRVSPPTFVEIGVENYTEANTRLLAERRLWRGHIIDQNPHLGRDLARTNLNWRSQVSATSTFVTPQNIRQIIEPFIQSDGLGLLSIDIDGVDYWVLEKLVDFEPSVIIVEYNALFGDEASVSVPHDATFNRTVPRYHNIYYGASLAAYHHLLSSNGYSLVACVSAGNNAFFVRTDRLGDVPARTVRDAYRPRRFVEHRDVDGTLTGVADVTLQLGDIAHLPLVNVTDGSTICVGDLIPGVHRS